MPEKKKRSFAQFVKEGVFYRVDKASKDYVQKEIMESDHRIFRRLLIIVFVLQIAMLLYKVLGNLGSFVQKDYYYIICYSVLAVCCVISLFVSEHQYKKKANSAYFITIAIMIDIFFAWALAIALLDSTRGTELTTFAYATVALAAIVVLEPWIFILDSIGFCSLLCILIAVLPELKFYTSVVISSVSICILISLISTINFNRRIDIINMQRKIVDLNIDLKQQSNVDVLTDIYNRRYLTNHINDSLTLGITPSGVIMFDIDDFKHVNDEYGHAAGDDCLIEIGKAIKEFVKEHEKCYAVRYGGEEFLIFITRTDRMRLLREAEAFRKKIEALTIVTEDGVDIKITISIGIALAKSGQSYSDLINKADSCLYSAKKSGKNKVCVE